MTKRKANSTRQVRSDKRKKLSWHMTDDNYDKLTLLAKACLQRATPMAGLVLNYMLKELQKSKVLQEECKMEYGVWLAKKRAGYHTTAGLKRITPTIPLSSYEILFDYVQELDGTDASIAAILCRFALQDGTHLYRIQQQCGIPESRRLKIYCAVDGSVEYILPFGFHFGLSD